MMQRPSTAVISTALTLGLVAGLHLGSAASAQSQAESQAQAQSNTQSQSQAQTLQKQVEQAYARIDQYQSHIKYEVVQNDQRWKRTRQTDMTIAFNRPKRLLSVDRPSVLVNANGQSLRLNFRQIDDKYLKKQLNDKPLAFSMLTDTLPALRRPAFADLLLLISDSPWAAMVGQANANSGAKVKVEQVDADQADQPTLKVTGKAGAMTLHIDPETHLVHKAMFAVNPQAAGMKEGQSARETFTINVQQRNGSLPDDAFAFDIGDAQAVDSLSALAGKGSGGGGQQGSQPQPRRGGQGAANQQHPLTGKQAPPISLTQADGSQFNLKDIDADVVVLDFWASWCGPCRVGLPRIQALANWAGQNDKSVAVYTVNIGESKAKAQAYWKKADLSLPIVLDKNKQVAVAYRANAIPQTVIIHEGKVAKVHVGLAPEGTLKEDVKAVLNQ